MTTTWNKTSKLLAAGGALLAGSVPAFAHHPMGGTTPATLWQGFASGVGHPVIGIDHLAFILAVGLAAALLGRVVVLPLVFIAATAIGCLLHLMSVGLPLAEIVIAGSVVLLGALVAFKSVPTLPVAAALVALAGVLHGHAYGEAIFGAEPTPVLAYLAGFAAIQFAIAVTTAEVARRALAVSIEAIPVRVAGGLAAGIGIAAAWGQLVAIVFPGMAG